MRTPGTKKIARTPKTLAADLLRRRLRAQIAQAVVVERRERRKIAIVLIPGALAAGGGIADGRIVDVPDGPAIGADVRRRSMNDVAVEEGNGTGRPLQSRGSAIRPASAVTVDLSISITT